ncbi:acyl-CoA dehydrogenase family protein [Hyphobacterium sp. CCMP332]|nr:acyl-CoA dehydrogenase family protein [Hyphobacterium sp. CCMP332]
METVDKKMNIKGGEFLIKETDSSDVFIPEEWNEEQKMIAQMCDDFLASEVLPNLDRIDALEEGLMPQLMDKAGELGLLATAIPEAYEGFGKGFNDSLLIAERTGAGHSFAVALSAHTGIGTLPILYFGTEEQKKKYLPKLASGEFKASYCLTEPGSGSDALAAKTKAELTKDGKHYVLNGQKMWITNAGFADLFIVFAKIDGEKFTGFVVEKGTPGLSLGNEEHKMGIKGSSTRQVFFEDCKIPKENILGEVGKGHIIAFNILNIGRIKLGAAVLGGSKSAAHHTIMYANERHQFQRPISSFGAIKHKIAEQAIKIFATESALYRAGMDIEKTENALLEKGKTPSEALLGAAEEFAIECAILKVMGSETLDYVVDEGVQTFGGYGFSAEYVMDRAYRDARINRIFEGTNEINRMLIIDMYLKRAMKGQLDLMTPASNVQKELMEIPDFGDEEQSLFSEEKKLIANAKKAGLMCAGSAAQKYMQKLADEQEILMALADMVIKIYEAESAILRAEKYVGIHGEEKGQLRTDLAKVCLYDAMDEINRAGKTVINAFAEGDMLRMMLLGLKRFTKTPPFNSIEARRRIADFLIKENTYKLD